MHAVYILLCKDKTLCVGCTSGLKQRLVRHIQGQVPSTKNKLPVGLIYYEVLRDKTEAFQRERYFKNLWSARFKKHLKQLNLP